VGFVEIHTGKETFVIGEPKETDRLKSFKCAGSCQRFLPADDLDLVVTVERRTKLVCNLCSPQFVDIMPDVVPYERMIFDDKELGLAISHNYELAVIKCIWCTLHDDQSQAFDTRNAMIVHLLEHELVHGKKLPPMIAQAVLAVNMP